MAAATLLHDEVNRESSTDAESDTLRKGEAATMQRMIAVLWVDTRVSRGGCRPTVCCKSPHVMVTDGRIEGRIN